MRSRHKTTEDGGVYFITAHSILKCNAWESKKKKQELFGKYVPKLELGNEIKGWSLGTR